MNPLILLQAHSSSSSWGIWEWLFLVFCILLVVFAAKSVFKKEDKNIDLVKPDAPSPIQQKEWNALKKDDTNTRIQKLKRLQELKEAGVLSNDEVEKEKQKILG